MRTSKSMSSRKQRSSSRGALVSGCGHLSWLDTIRTYLSAENQNMLNASCFGHLLAIPYIQFQGQLYNVLLRKLDKSSLARLRLMFRINDCKIEFEPREFCDIQKSFVKECIESCGESRNVFVLALLYILYGILLIHARKGKRIDIKYLHLVDDLEKFNSYSWGQVAYDF